MDVTIAGAAQTRDVTDLFAATFAESEGSAAGEQIGRLVASLLTTVDAADIFVFCAVQDDRIAGAVIFTRMRYPEDERTVFILSPMAVAPPWQGKGVGQKLLAYALETLRQNGVDVVLTYGDINFYAKAGFTRITKLIARPPLPLSYPAGWLGASLTDRPLDPVQGPSHCVRALNDPALW